MIGPAGQESGSQYPCFEHATLTDLLNKKFVSWRYYAPSAGSIWTAPNAIQHTCGPNVAPPNGRACVGADWTDNVVLATPRNPAPVLRILPMPGSQRELGHYQMAWNPTTPRKTTDPVHHGLLPL